MQIESDMTKEMHNWGWWVQDCPSRSLNYPSKSNTTISRSGTVFKITDERAMKIDAAIAHLFNGDEQAKQAIKLKFVCGFSYRKLAATLDITKEKSQSIIDNSVSWIDGYLYAKK